MSRLWAAVVLWETNPFAAESIKHHVKHSQGPRSVTGERQSAPRGAIAGLSFSSFAAVQIMKNLPSHGGDLEHRRNVLTIKVHY